MENPQTMTIILGLIGLLLIGGCMVSILVLTLFNIKYPDSPQFLTDRLRERAWNSRQVLILSLALAFGIVFSSLLGAIFSSWESEFVPLIVAYIFASIQLGALILLGRRRRTTWSEDFSMDSHMLKRAGLAPLIYLAAMPLIGIAASIYHFILRHFFGIEPNIQAVIELIGGSSSWIKAGYIFLAVLAAPFYEELIFRGTFLPFMVRRFGLVPGIIIVSLLFASIHFNLAAIVPLFLFSVVLCFTYWRTGTLWSSIALHALFNGVTVALAPLQMQ